MTLNIVEALIFPVFARKVMACAYLFHLLVYRMEVIPPECLYLFLSDRRSTSHAMFTAIFPMEECREQQYNISFQFVNFTELLALAAGICCGVL